MEVDGEQVGVRLRLRRRLRVRLRLGLGIGLALTWKAKWRETMNGWPPFVEISCSTCVRG